MSLDLVLVGGEDATLAAMLRQAGHETKRLALERLEELAAPGVRPPQVLLLDIRCTPELPLSLSVVKREHPALPVVLVASRLDPMVMLEAMRIGVNEFLADPVTEADLVAAIARVSTSRAGGALGQVIAFIGAKGGVGTTTLAVNVATTVSVISAGHTLLMDLHMMSGDAAVFLGVEPRFSIVDALENAQRLDDSFFKSLIVRSKSGLDLLASGERVVVGHFDSGRIRSLIEFAARRYRFVILDVPRFDPVVLDALHAAGALVVVTSQEVASVRSAGRLSGTLAQLYGRDKVKMVVARANAAAEIGREDIERALGTGIRHEIPSDYRLALQALNAGRPLALENHNRLSSSIHQLARDLSGLAEKPAGDRKSGGFLGLLGGRRG